MPPCFVHTFRLLLAKRISLGLRSRALALFSYPCFPARDGSLPSTSDTMLHYSVAPFPPQWLCFCCFSLRSLCPLARSFRIVKCSLLLALLASFDLHRASERKYLECRFEPFGSTDLVRQARQLRVWPHHTAKHSTRASHTYFNRCLAAERHRVLTWTMTGTKNGADAESAPSSCGNCHSTNREVPLEAWPFNRSTITLLRFVKSSGLLRCWLLRSRPLDRG